MSQERNSINRAFCNNITFYDVQKFLKSSLFKGSKREIEEITEIIDLILMGKTHHDQFLRFFREAFESNVCDIEELISIFNLIDICPNRTLPLDTNLKLVKMILKHKLPNFDIRGRKEGDLRVHMLTPSNEDGKKRTCESLMRIPFVFAFGIQDNELQELLMNHPDFEDNFFNEKIRVYRTCYNQTNYGTTTISRYDLMPYPTELRTYFIQ